MRILEQLLAGRDFARLDPAADQMANFVYLLGDEEAGKAVLVDPAWDLRGLLQIVEERGLKLEGAVITHAHQDHAGGKLFGLGIEGVSRLVELRPEAKVWVHELDSDRLLQMTGLAEERLERVRGGDQLALGETVIDFIHTPGHTPGGMCLKVGDAVLTGDTLFVGECGRIDLEGSDPLAMWASLNQTLAALPDETRVLPGHDYGRTRTSTIGEEKRSNPNLGVTLEQWRASLGI